MPAPPSWTPIDSLDLNDIKVLLELVCAIPNWGYGVDCPTIQSGPFESEFVSIDSPAWVLIPGNIIGWGTIGSGSGFSTFPFYTYGIYGAGTLYYSNIGYNTNEELGYRTTENPVYEHFSMYYNIFLTCASKAGDLSNPYHTELAALFSTHLAHWYDDSSAGLYQSADRDGELISDLRAFADGAWALPW